MGRQVGNYGISQRENLFQINQGNHTSNANRFYMPN